MSLILDSDLSHIGPEKLDHPAGHDAKHMRNTVWNATVVAKGIIAEVFNKFEKIRRKRDLKKKIPNHAMQCTMNLTEVIAGVFLIPEESSSHQPSDDSEPVCIRFADFL